MTDRAAATSPNLQAVSGPAPLPAKLCRAGHPNDPRAKVCWTCDQELDPAAAVVTRVPGVLARLVLEDGTAIGLADDLMIGRSPVGEGRRATLTISGPQVSRRHLILEIDGWRIYVKDCGSTNGTFLSRRGERGRRRVPTGHHVPLRMGETIHFGSRQALVARSTAG